MATNEIPNDVANLLRDGATTYAGSSTGPGGDWPPAGKVNAYFAGIRATASTFNMGKDQQAIPCVAVQADWVWETESGNELRFEGKRFRLVPNFEVQIKEFDPSSKRPDLPTWQFRQAREEWQRYKSFASKMLDRGPAECDNPLADLEDLMALANSDSQLQAQLEITEEDVNGTLYRADRVIQVLAR